MKSHDVGTLRLEKLRSSRLYSLCSEAFEVATGCKMELRLTPGTEPVTVSFEIGEGVELFLTMLGNSSCDGQQMAGLLRSCALQLQLEANRAVMEPLGAEPKYVQEARVYILKHLRAGHHLDEVADAVGVCPFQLCRSFKAATGMTMTEYGSRLRVEMARNRLMDPGRPIAVIAEESGFTSLSQFNRNFLKYAGESPSSYRLRLRKLEHCDLTAV